MQLEPLFVWAAVTLYAAGAIVFVVGFVFGREAIVRTGGWVAVVGLVPHLLAIGVRWARVGHGPYLGFFEVVSSFALVSVLAFALLVWRYRSLRAVGLVLLPLAFLLMAGAMLAPRADVALTPTLASWWLTIHVTFAKLTYGSFMVSFVLALVYLVRGRARGAWANLLEKLPSQAVIDDLSFKFVSVGFIFLTIMIVAGAIWANEAWGRYWGWDPVETWSLISWLVYAAYLHLRMTWGWKGRKAAWVAVLALPVLVFALIGVPLVYNSIHGAYIKGT